MTEKEIEINKAFIKKGIDMSFVSAENLETGFVSGQVRNQLDNQEVIEIATALRSITHPPPYPSIFKKYLNIMSQTFHTMFSKS